MAQIRTNTSYEFEIGQSIRIHCPFAQAGGPPILAKIVGINGDNTVVAEPAARMFQPVNLSRNMLERLPVVARGSIDPKSPYINDRSAWGELVLGMSERELDKPTGSPFILSLLEKKDQGEAPEPEVEQNEDPEPVVNEGPELYKDAEPMALVWKGSGKKVGSVHSTVLEIDDDLSANIEVVYEDDETRGQRFWLVTSDHSHFENIEFQTLEDAKAYVERAATALLMPA